MGSLNKNFGRSLLDEEGADGTSVLLWHFFQGRLIDGKLPGNLTAEGLLLIMPPAGQQHGCMHLLRSQRGDGADVWNAAYSFDAYDKNR
ncbi:MULTISPECIES: hypothetical protein [Brucella]|uniref:hypothetical protein n=1 Tax=Brucella TaxID=234 RepID=UPI0015E86292|nr:MULTISPECIES: hypothetical protein [Brucella]MBN7701902.1 hypothetical protein [Brucella melitensis]MCH1762883.1 hypothetical protein [Brucella abortus]